MDYQIIELEEFNVIGIRYELSKSLSNNVKLAQNHWKIFNSKLRNNKLYLGSNWCKYAFIEKIENTEFEIDNEVYGTLKKPLTIEKATVDTKGYTYKVTKK